VTNPPISEEESVQLFNVQNLTREFGGSRLKFLKKRGVKALDGVNLEVRKNESLGLVGESGSGKTTLGRILVGLDRPTSGQVSYLDKNIASLTGSEKKRFHHQVQMIFQNPFASLNPYRSILDILESGFKSLGNTNKAEMRTKIIALLEKVGMHRDSLDRFPHQFSGGQRQRLVIARALSVDPKVLIADEPVSALDVSIQAQVLNLLNDLKESLGLTIVFITHDLRVANFFCDRIAVMYKGRIVELGDTEAVIEHSVHPYTRMLMDSAPSGDPDEKTKRIIEEDSVEGSTRKSLTTGCSFADRCWLRRELKDDSKCLSVVPEPRLVNGTNLVECHHAELVTETLLEISRD
jgi:oligopeptide transport system ATP-binding protein